MFLYTKLLLNTNKKIKQANDIKKIIKAVIVLWLINLNKFNIIQIPYIYKFYIIFIKYNVLSVFSI